MTRKYLIRKFFFYVISIWVALTINFAIPRLMPGDPASVVLARARGQMNPQALDALMKAFGFTGKNLFLQYIEYLSNVFRGNFGISITYFPTPVSELISQALPWTLFLFGFATIMSFVLGTVIGIFLAWRRNSISDATVTPFSIFLHSFPAFWIALLILYIIGFKMDLIPIAHGYNPRIDTGFNRAFIGSAVLHAVGPLLSIVLVSIGGWILLIRNNMISILEEDFITMAQAEGLKERMIMFGYAARNAILPSVTAFTMSMGFVFTGSLLTEIVFSYPGVGFLLYQGVLALDYPVLQSAFFILAVVMMTANFLVDIIYVKLDPRTSEVER
ncbi:MAG: ABC transporter permease [Candidatus Bipolaricaulia bacterium]